MCHPRDGGGMEAFQQQISRICESRNVRPDLCTYGFSPFGM